MSPWIADYLRLPVSLVILTGITIVISFASGAASATLQGMRRFRFLACMGIVGPVVKLLCGLLSVWMGYHLFGAIGGFVVSGGILCLGSILYASALFRTIPEKGTTQELVRHCMTSWRSLLDFVLVSVGFALLMNIDVIIARNIFDDQTSGLYAGLAVFAKFLVFLLLSIETVYYGQIMEHRGKAFPKHLGRNALLLMSITSIAALASNTLL
jgi:O-antigen/teichoic acid export membrane protein